MIDISCELSAKTIHMENHDLFFWKVKKKIKSKLSSAAVVIGAFRVTGHQLQCTSLEYEQLNFDADLN